MMNPFSCSTIFEDDNGNGSQCLLSLLATGHSRRINTLVLSFSLTSSIHWSCLSHLPCQNTGSVFFPSLHQYTGFVFLTFHVNTLVLFFSLATSIHWFCLFHSPCQNTGSVIFTRHINTIVCSVLMWSSNAKSTIMPVLAGENLHMSQTPFHQRLDASTTDRTPKTFMLRFFYASGTPHARYVHTRFKFWGRPFCSSLLASFFLLVLLWKKFIMHSFVVTFHFSCSPGSPPVFFIYPGTVARFIWTSAVLPAYTAHYSLSLWTTNPG